MYEDDPQEKVFDVLGHAVFGDHPLGRAIIGHAPVIADTPAAEIARFHASRYTAEQHRDRRRGRRRPRRLCRAGGSPPSDRCSRWRGARLGSKRHPSCRRRPRRLSRVASSARTPSSSTSASADRACHATTSAALRCACSTRSSAAPRPRGCSRRCASVTGLPTRSTRSPSAYQDSGQIGLYVGTRADNLGEAIGRRRRRAGAAAQRACDRRGAGPRQGEPEGPRAAGARVDRSAHEPPGLGDRWPRRRCSGSTRWSRASTPVHGSDLEELAGELWDPATSLGRGDRPRRAALRGSAFAVADAVTAA